MRIPTVGAVTAALVSSAITMASGQGEPPQFRAMTTAVTVAVSVKRGGNFIPNLQPADFQLTDDAVPQKVEVITIEALPVDVTFFLDTSGSTASKLDDIGRDVQGIVTMLRPGDRFRMLTIGDAVEETVPWTAAGSRVTVSFHPVGGISLIQDALMIGLLHHVEPGRRHLMVGMTDRQDCGSVIPSTVLLDAAARTETVMHLVDYAGISQRQPYRVRACTPLGARQGAATIEQAAVRTGGALHTPSGILGSISITRAFREILEDFRQSYVLRYSPSGVKVNGWHAIVVRVPGLKNATVRARQGYYRD